MDNYSKLYSEIVMSSIWAEDDKTRLVWITMLALKDQVGYVPAAIPGLAGAARVSIDDCEKAINKLESPDKYSRTPDNEGRRIQKVKGGWIVLNHKAFNERGMSELQKEQNRERVRRYREKHHDVMQCNGVCNADVMVKPTNINTNININQDKNKNLSDKSDDVNVYPDDFVQFWKSYPRKEAKKKALKAWKKAKDKPVIKELLRIIETQKQSEQWQKDGGQFIPMPEAWLNAGRWMDEPTKPPAPAAHKDAPHRQSFEEIRNEIVLQLEEAHRAGGNSVSQRITALNDTYRTVPKQNGISVVNAAYEIFKFRNKK